MATLTASEILSIRYDIGDTALRIDNSDAYIISDAGIQDINDDAGGNYSLTRVFCLRRMLGFFAKMVDSSNVTTGTRESKSQQFTNVKRLLEYWENIYAKHANNLQGGATGTTVGDTNTDPNATAGLGVLGLNIDSDHNDSFSDTPNTYTMWG